DIPPVIGARLRQDDAKTPQSGPAATAIAKSAQSIAAGAGASPEIGSAAPMPAGMNPSSVAVGSPAALTARASTIGSGASNEMRTADITRPELNISPQAGAGRNPLAPARKDAIGEHSAEVDRVASAGPSTRPGVEAISDDQSL